MPRIRNPFAVGWFTEIDSVYYLIREFSDGLICLSGCLSAEIPKLVVAGNLKGARDKVDNFEREDDLDLADDAVSQTHAMVFVDEAGVSLVDVASTNGTFVNGRKVTEADLVGGDLLRVGETRIEIRDS